MLYVSPTREEGTAWTHSSFLVRRCDRHWLVWPTQPVAIHRLMIPIAITIAGEERTYAALVPLSFRFEVHHFIAEHTDVCPPLDGGTLVLTEAQARKVIDIARSQEAAARPAPVSIVATGCIDSSKSTSSLVFRSDEEGNDLPA